MHALENLLLILSARIRHETGNEELAEAAATFASASHEYIPEREKILAEMNDDWTRRHSNLIVKPQAGTSQLPISSEEQLRTLRKFVNDAIDITRDHGRVVSESVAPLLRRVGAAPGGFASRSLL